MGYALYFVFVEYVSRRHLPIACIAPVGTVVAVGACFRVSMYIDIAPKVRDSLTRSQSPWLQCQLSLRSKWWTPCEPLTLTSQRNVGRHRLRHATAATHHPPTQHSFQPRIENITNNFRTPLASPALIRGRQGPMAFLAGLTPQVPLTYLPRAAKAFSPTLRLRRQPPTPLYRVVAFRA